MRPLCSSSACAGADDDYVVNLRGTPDLQHGFIILQRRVGANWEINMIHGDYGQGRSFPHQCDVWSAFPPPCIRGLRATVWDLLDMLASGMTETKSGMIIGTWRSRFFRRLCVCVRTAGARRLGPLSQTHFVTSLSSIAKARTWDNLSQSSAHDEQWLVSARAKIDTGNRQITVALHNRGSVVS